MFIFLYFFFSVRKKSKTNVKILETESTVGLLVKLVKVDRKENYK